MKVVLSLRLCTRRWPVGDTYYNMPPTSSPYVAAYSAVAIVGGFAGACEAVAGASERRLRQQQKSGKGRL